MSEPIDDALRLSLWLAMLKGIGPRLQQVLLETFGTPQSVYTASYGELLNVPGIGNKLAKSITQQRSLDDVDAELQRCQQKNVTLYRRDSEDYPALLKETPDPPLILYCRGSLHPADQLSLAIVGSRNCTPYGNDMAAVIARDLSNAGVTVISGLARGIDAAAHRGALQGAGRTLAVTATGMHTVYPPEHFELAEEVASRGAILCEVPFGTDPIPGLFPQRNRIISGLSLGVLVIEAHRKSGTLYTARHAAEQGRDLFAMPGRVDSPASTGTHELIRDGAVLIRDAADILESLGPLPEPIVHRESQVVQTPRELSLNDQERTVLNAVGLEPTHIDEVLRSVDLDDSRVLSTLTILEMKSFLKRMPGGLLVRVP